MKSQNILFLIFSLFVFASCEDVIEVDVPQGEKAVVVEGWLTNKAEPHFVKLYYTRKIAGNSGYPAISNAKLTLSDDAGNSEELSEVSPGKYQITAMHGVEGRTYTLKIESPEGNYEAVAPLKRLSASPDSLLFKFEPKSAIYENEGYYPRYFGQDLEGLGDYVQVKLYRNGVYMNKAIEINLFEDKFVDGNYINDVELMVNKPFQKDEVVKAEAWSLTEDAFRFLRDIQTQLQNGQIFASPLENTRTNVRKTSTGARNVVGYFGASKVDSVVVKVE